MVLSQMDAGKALTAAAAKGNTSEVQRILEECRVHPDTRNEFGRTALQVRTSFYKSSFIITHLPRHELRICKYYV